MAETMLQAMMVDELSSIPRPLPTPHPQPLSTPHPLSTSRPLPTPRLRLNVITQ